MIKRFFTYNWKIKLFCLLLAVGFWTYVSAVGVRIDYFPGGVPLELRNVPDGMVAITDTQNIDVNIVSEKKLWTKISESSVVAYVNCSSLTEGTYELTVNVENKIAGIQISDYTPQQVLVRIEPKFTKEIGVKIKIDGSATDGMMASTAKINPEKVEIAGPKSVIDNIYEAVAVIRLDGESQEVQRKVTLQALDAEGNKINGVLFTPSEVEVILPIIKIDTTKNVGIKVNTIGNVTNGYWISNISTDPPMISIAGSAEILKNIYYIQTKPIDISGISENYTRSIDLDLPSGVTAIDNINSVLVNLIISHSSSVKNVQAKISNSNIPSYLTLVNVLPSDINVTISSDTVDLANINSSDVVLNLDLGNFISEGEYYIDINNSMFSVPEGVFVNSFTPSSLKINLQKK